MKKILLPTLLLLLFTTGYSQTVDSLRNLLPAATGTKKVDLLNLLAEFASQSPHAKGWIARADTQKHYATLALQEAEKTGYILGKAQALVHLGSSQWLYSIPLVQAKKDFIETMRKGENYSKAGLELAEGLQAYNLMGTAYLDLSGFQHRLNNDSRYRVENLKKAALYYNKAGNEAKEQEVSTWLCDESISSGSFEEGFPYCQRSAALAMKNIKLATSKEDKDYRIYLVQQSLVNLSSLHQMGGDYATAIDYLLQSRNFGAIYNSGWTMDAELAGVYTEMGKHDSALYYQNQSLTTYKDNIWVRMGRAETLIAVKDYDKAFDLLAPDVKNYWQGKATYRVLLPMGKIYAGKSNPAEALRLINHSLSKVTASSKTALLKHYEALSKVHHQLGNNDSAYYYQTKYQVMRDSVITRQFLWQLSNYKKAAEEEKRTGQLRLLQKDNLIKAQQLQQQLLAKDQNETLLALLSKDNRIKDQELQIKEQQLKEEMLFRERKQSELALLDREARLKDQQLKQETFLRKALLVGLLLFLLVGVLVFRGLALKRKADRLRNEKRQAEWQQQAVELEMQALRAQMNPHFVFNCLSSINKYILKKESRAASDYLTRFSRLIRRVLTNSQMRTISLSDEVEMLRLYLDMERLRFDHSFDYAITYASTLEPETIYVPPMLLQPFCENAIWHGLMHKQGEGRLEILLKMEKDALQCVITDNGIGRERATEIKSRSGEKQPSMGLKITTNRLALFNNSNLAQSDYQMEDVLDQQGQVVGTRVRLVIKCGESFSNTMTVQP